MDYESAEVPPIAGADHPAVSYRRVAGGVYFGAARSAAVRAATTPFVAFLEEHARARPGWAAAIVRAFHADPWAGVGYEVDNANSDGGFAWVNGLMSYGLFASPMPRGESPVISGNNVAYRREALLGVDADLERLLLVDIGLHVALHREGHRLFLDPDARIVHLNETTMGSTLRAYRHYHRLFGVTRAREGRWPLRRRLLYVAATPLIPIYYLVRFTRFLSRRRPGDVRRFLLYSPYIYAVQLVAAAAQAMGLLFGPGDAARGFSAGEVSEPRPGGEERGETT
jgi:GT2 family glycosyltransferase